MKTKTLDVVMIATDKSSIYLHNNKMYDNKVTMHIPDGDQLPQHLYFTSDCEIKENDWYIHNQKPTGLRIQKCLSLMLPMDARKIEATTDTKLGYSDSAKLYEGGSDTVYTLFKPLSQIPQSFIEAYIKPYNFGNPILTVDVELMFQLHDGTETTELLNNRIKTNSSNEVIIVEVDVENSPEYIMELFYIENDSNIQKWSDSKQLILKYTEWLSINNYKIIK